MSNPDQSQLIVQALDLLDTDWRPTLLDGALLATGRCASPLEVAYIMGAAYWLEQRAKLPILLRPSSFEGQPGVWFHEPWVGWKLSGIAMTRPGPMAMQIVPQAREYRNDCPHTFIICYANNEEDPFWRSRYVIDLSPTNKLVVSSAYHRRRITSVQPSPLIWFQAILLLESANV